MNEKLNDLMNRVRAGAAAAGEFAAKTASTAGKKANEVFHVSKHNLAIFDLNNEIDLLYKEIGKMVYLSHCNEDTSTERLDEMLQEIDAKLQEVEALRGQIDDIRDVQECRSCGARMEKDAQFCSKCGAKAE